MLLPGLAEVGELTFRHTDFDLGLQILDPRGNRDARFRTHAGKQTIANLERPSTAVQLHRSLFFVDVLYRCDAEQRSQTLDVFLALLIALAVPVQLHLDR